MADPMSETRELLECRDPGKRQDLLARKFTAHRERLRSLLQSRLHDRLRSVLDPSDVLQEAFVEVSQRLDQYLKDPRLPLYPWFRTITGQKLWDLQGFHLEVQKRDARRTVSIDGHVMPEVSSAALVSRLATPGPTPSDLAIRHEAQERLREAIDHMDALDREILALRLYESLSSVEAAEILGIGVPAARKRFLRAMRHLKGITAKFSGE